MKTLARILKKHEGRPVDFKGCNDAGTINGRVEKVQNGMATIRYWMPEAGSTEGFTAIVPVRSERIVQVW